MTDATVRHRTSSELVSWRRDGVVAMRRPAAADANHELVSVAESVAFDDGPSDVYLSAVELLRSGRTTNEFVASLVETAERLTGEPTEFVAARIVDVGHAAVGLPARQLVHEAMVPDLVATCAVLVSRDLDTCVLALSPARHRDVLIADDDGLLPVSAERALTWRPMEVAVGLPVWIHPLAPIRVAPATGPGRPTLLLLHFARAEAPTDLDRVATTPFDAPVPIASPTAPPITWMAPTNASAVADAIVQLFDTHGRAPYLHGVDHGAHALQTGAHAMAAGASVSMIVAAFLHDIGLLIGAAPRQSQPGTSVALPPDQGVSADHAVAGAALLERWFTIEVTRPIRLHVAAQRYLEAVDEELVGLGSVGGGVPLRHETSVGQPMGPAEMLAFESTEGWLDALRLRQWDAAAVEPGAPTPSLDTFRTLIESVAVVDRSLR